MARPRPIQHGTYGGYQAHRTRGETACNACIDASRAYRRKLFAAKPELEEDRRFRAAARSRALCRLRAEYPERFRQLFIEEVTR